jgi:hypothetical protein
MGFMARMIAGERGRRKRKSAAIPTFRQLAAEASCGATDGLRAAAAWLSIGCS